MLKSIFDTLELEMADRFRLSWVSASEAPRWTRVVKEFTEQVEQLGPSSVCDELFI